MFSKWLEIILGIPQGSILGPLLFNIFINDIFYFLLETEICNFADDNTIYACDVSFDNVCNRLENDLLRINRWFKFNSLVANPKKFQLMFLGENIPSNYSIFNSGLEISSRNEVELLGIIIDKKLTFSNHIKRICKKANNKICAFLRFRRDLSLSQAKVIYNSFILSQFLYCPVIWMFCHKSDMNMINKTHKRALRTVYNDHTLDLPELFGLENCDSIHNRHLQLLMVEVYKTINKHNPQLLWDLFPLKEMPYNLRTISLIKLPKTHTVTYGTNSLLFKASLIWNNLPNNLKECDNVNTFKRKIKSWKGVL